jgi:glycosyltransferase involved in cell wall biosynthesis
LKVVIAMVKMHSRHREGQSGFSLKLANLHYTISTNYVDTMLRPLQNSMITVVIPTYNRLALVQQAIQSVLAQTYPHWELYVVDDGSEDGTSETVSLMQDNRIKLLKMPHTGNIAQLRNAGVKAGSGEWLAFLDSDDCWVPQRLEIQLTKLLKAGSRWGYGGFELMDGENYTIPNKAGIYRPISGWIAREALTTEASVAIGAVLVQRTLFDEAGGFNTDPELVLREDYELVLRLTSRAEAMAIPELLVRIREHEGRSTTAFEYGHERMAFVYEHFIRTHPEKSLEKIARRRLAHELAESSVKRIRQKEYLLACKNLGRALVNGDRLRHLLSAVRRGLFTSDAGKE